MKLKPPNQRFDPQTKILDFKVCLLSQFSDSLQDQNVPKELILTKKEFVHFSAKREAHKIHQNEEKSVFFWRNEVEVAKSEISTINQNFGLQSVSFHSLFQQFTESKMYQKSSFLTKRSLSTFQPSEELTKRALKHSFGMIGWKVQLPSKMLHFLATIFCFKMGRPKTQHLSRNSKATCFLRL